VTIEYREAASRFVTRAEGRTTRHSFSFGAHYDPGNTGFASLVAHNDERLPPGTGYDEHRHADLEIVTWVLSGSLRHVSSVGEGVIGPGQVQRLSAGSGVQHSETSAVSSSSMELVETRFLQSWVRPDRSGTPPDYRSAAVAVGADWTTVVGAEGAVPLGTAGASLLVAQPPAGHRLVLPDAPRLHVFVATGAAMLGERRLEPGDAARLVGEGSRELTAEVEGQVLVWAFG
jgi:redox-sensitive bicupin YhaK (pirin superfamily)